jgi:hypothetical protein
MNKENIDLYLSLRQRRFSPRIEDVFNAESIPKRAEPKNISYTARHRGVWFKPEYDFTEIQIAQRTDSFFSRSVIKKLNKVIVAGLDIVGDNSESVEYIKKRLLEMSFATNRPWEQLVWDTFFDLFRYSNCLWAKVRSEESSSGEIVVYPDGSERIPVAGYYILPFESLQFKTKVNGSLKKVMQVEDGREKEWGPNDVVHFYINRSPGFLVGTPEVLPVLDDLALLRRIEENVEDLIETNLFPVYHYQVGSDTMPERFDPNGVKETDVVRRKLQYMPSGGIYISDHRHSISAIGSEGRALRIDFYLTYFKNRVLSGLGTSALDVGEGDTANKSTASTMSKGMLMDVEAMTKVVKSFLEFYVINELLLEGGFDPMEKEDQVRLKFGVIDKDDRRADENQQIQLFHGNLRTMGEIRESLGDTPWSDEHYEQSHYKMFEEPADLLKSMQPGSAAGDVLANHSASSVTSQAVNKEKTFAQQTLNKQLAAKKAGRPVTKSKSKSASSTSKSKSRPSNQHGTRSSAKTIRDISLVDNKGEEILIACNFDIDDSNISLWNKEILSRYHQLDGNVSFESIAASMMWRIRRVDATV